MLKKHIACILRIALLVACINALAPTISYLFAASAGKQVVEICTSFGVKRVLLDTAETPSAPTEHEPSVRCQYCLASMDAAAFILPPAAATPGCLHFSTPVFSAVFPPDLRKRWPEARPRAPPFLSA